MLAVLLITREDSYDVRVRSSPGLCACLAGNKEIATFLLENGAGFSSYTLMDHPDFSLELLRQRLLVANTSTAPGGSTEVEVSQHPTH